MTPLILDKEEDGDDADDHGAGDADDDHQATVHLVTILLGVLHVIVRQLLRFVS